MNLEPEVHKQVQKYCHKEPPYKLVNTLCGLYTQNKARSWKDVTCQDCLNIKKKQKK